MAGLTESELDRIDDPDAFPAATAAALRFTDRYLLGSGAPTTRETAALDAHFDAAARVELGLGIALPHGFSKMLIVLGLEPDGPMDTLVQTTPAIPKRVDTSALPDAPIGDAPEVAMLAGNRRLAALWEHMAAALDSQPWLPSAALEAARSRTATMHGLSWAATPVPIGDPLVQACVAVAEMFVADVHAVTDDMAARVVDLAGPEAFTTLAAALAIWEGIYRLAATWGWEPPDRRASHPAHGLGPTTSPVT